MKIICNNPKNIIIAVVFACICLASAAPAEAGCYQVCDPMYAPCPSGYSVYTNQMLPWPWSPYGWACFPCGGYCWLSGGGHAAGPVCATGPYSGCINIGPYLTGWNCYERCDGECNNSIRNACTIPNSLINSIWQGENATDWTWYCPGKNGGSNSVQCSFPKPSPVNGSCQTFPSGIDPLPSSKCLTGTASAVLGLGTNSSPWTWTCLGSNGGADAPCSAKKPCVYNNYQCTRLTTDVKCAETYPENCEKSLAVNMICSATDVNRSCSGVISQSDCVAAGVPCSNDTETCASCPLKPGMWREVAP